MKNNLPIKKGIYEHYKGNLYDVIGEVWHSETKEKLVLYRALYNDKEFGKTALWIRPKKMFLEKVLVKGKKAPRFKYLNYDKETTSVLHEIPDILETFKEVEKDRKSGAYKEYTCIEEISAEYDFLDKKIQDSKGIIKRVKDKNPEKKVFS